jgi:hypothetical protein
MGVFWIGSVVCLSVSGQQRPNARRTDDDGVWRRIEPVE